MPERPTDYQTLHAGVPVTIRGVPTRFSETGDELGFSLRVARQLEALVLLAVQQAAGQHVAELPYQEPPSSADPVSRELRRALRQRGVSSAQVARQLGVTPPVVSRWLSPDYHAHGMDALRRIAEALDMDLEVRLVPKRSA